MVQYQCDTGMPRLNGSSHIRSTKSSLLPCHAKSSSIYTRPSPTVVHWEGRVMTQHVRSVRFGLHSMDVMSTTRHVGWWWWRWWSGSIHSGIHNSSSSYEDGHNKDMGEEEEVVVLVVEDPDSEVESNKTKTKTKTNKCMHQWWRKEEADRTRSRSGNRCRCRCRCWSPWKWRGCFHFISRRREWCWWWVGGWYWYRYWWSYAVTTKKAATGRPQQEEKSRRFIFRLDSTRRGNGSGSTGYKERKQKCRRKTNQRRVQLLRYTYCTYSIAVVVGAADDHQQQQLL